MSHWLTKFSAFVLIVSFAASVEAETRLERYLGTVNTLTADFEQAVYDQRQRVQQQMKGQLYIQRPGKFRWDYSVPYAQEIVADGEKIWFYDIDLEQVTVKAQAQAVSGTPALILSKPHALNENFIIIELGRVDGLQWFELEPRTEDAGFEKLRLAMDDQHLRSMRLLDSFGQMTELTFTNVKINQLFSESVFRFQPPADVDVIDETAFQP